MTGNSLVRQEIRLQQPGHFIDKNLLKILPKTGRGKGPGGYWLTK